MLVVMVIINRSLELLHSALLVARDQPVEIPFQINLL